MLRRLDPGMSAAPSASRQCGAHRLSGYHTSAAASAGKPVRRSFDPADRAAPAVASSALSHVDEGARKHRAPPQPMLLRWVGAHGWPARVSSVQGAHAQGRHSPAAASAGKPTRSGLPMPTGPRFQHRCAPLLPSGGVHGNGPRVATPGSPPPLFPRSTKAAAAQSAGAGQPAPRPRPLRPLRCGRRGSGRGSRALRPGCWCPDRRSP